MNILIMGRPGAGKGTQATSIKEYYQIPHISTGDMFRAAVKNATTLGKLAKRYMDAGQLVPDDVTIGIVKERFLEDDCKKGFLLDGYPRTISQAESLDNMLHELGIKLDCVLNIDVPVDVLIERIVGRRVCKNCGATFHIAFNKPNNEGICDVCGMPLIQRADDQKETALSRLAVYDEKTAPLLDYYQAKDLLHDINGDQSFEEVFADIQNIIGN